MDKEQKPFRNNIRRRKKVCAFCADKVEFIDYKNADKLRKYVSERGKILPRRVMGTCARHQRELTTAIKRARQIALLPYDAEVTRLAKAKHFAYSKPEAVKAEEKYLTLLKRPSSRPLKSPLRKRLPRLSKRPSRLLRKRLRKRLNNQLKTRYIVMINRVFLRFLLLTIIRLYDTINQTE